MKEKEHSQLNTKEQKDNDDSMDSLATYFGVSTDYLLGKDKQAQKEISQLNYLFGRDDQQAQKDTSSEVVDITLYQALVEAGFIKDGDPISKELANELVKAVKVLRLIKESK